VGPPPDPLAPLAGRLAALAEASPGRETCGLVLDWGECAWEVRPLANAAGDPARAYALAPADLLAALRELDGRGGRLAAVFHSHPSGGADLSRRDLEAALCDGRPLLDGVAQVVVALSDGRAEAVRVHRWDGRRYAGRDLWRRPPPGS
jgi:proteasome lid subunit RPN8/RPN11